MKENNEILDETLFELSQAILNKGYRDLVKWLVDFRFGKTGSNQFSDDFKKTIKDVEKHIKIYKKFLGWSRFNEAEEFFKDTIRPILNNFQQSYPPFIEHTENLSKVFIALDEIQSISSSEDLERIEKILNQVIKIGKLKEVDKEYYLKLSVYEKKLEKSNFLTQEIYHILKNEYNTRLETTKNRLLTVIEPHKKNISSLQNEIKKLNEKRRELEKEASLSSKDKNELLEVLELKKNNLVNRLAICVEEDKKYNQLLKNIKEGFTSFNNLLNQLQSQLESAKIKQEYLDSIESIGENLPQDQAGFQAMKAAFDQAEFQKNILQSKDSFQNQILKAIEEQRNWDQPDQESLENQEAHSPDPGKEDEEGLLNYEFDMDMKF